MNKTNTLRISLLSPLALGGCAGANPSRNILGSYFPSWMLCAAAALITTGALHRLFDRLEVEKHIPARSFVYPALIVSLSCLFWLLRFGN